MSRLRPRLRRALRSRRPNLPAEVVAELRLAPGEHVIAHAVTTEGRAVVATDRALYVPSPPSWRAVGWERVAHASWEGDRLHVAEVGAPGESPPRHVLELADPGLVPDAVHDRVTSTIVVSQHVPVRGAAGVRIIARRVPGREAEGLTWSMAFDPGLDSQDPDVRAAAGTALEELRQQLGV